MVHLQASQSGHIQPRRPFTSLLLSAVFSVSRDVRQRLQLRSARAVAAQHLQRRIVEYLSRKLLLDSPGSSSRPTASSATPVLAEKRRMLRNLGADVLQLAREPAGGGEGYMGDEKVSRVDAPDVRAVRVEIVMPWGQGPDRPWPRHDLGPRHHGDKRHRRVRLHVPAEMVHCRVNSRRSP